MDDQREAFASLQRLGVIEREGYDQENRVFTYRWTKFGRKVADRLIEAPG